MLQEDSLPAEPQGKPENTGVGSLSLLQRIFPTQESNWCLLHCRQIFYQLNYQGNPKMSFNRKRKSKWYIYTLDREPFSSSCKDMALDLRSTLIHCDLTLIHFVSKDTVSKRGPIVGFGVELNFVVTVFIQCVWRLKSALTRNVKFLLLFQLKTFSEGTRLSWRVSGR